MAWEHPETNWLYTWGYPEKKWNEGKAGEAAGHGPSMSRRYSGATRAGKPGGHSLATDPGLGSYSPSKGSEHHHFPAKSETILVWSVENGF